MVVAIDPGYAVNPAQIERQIARLKLGESIMDSVADHAGGLKKTLGATDRDRLDQYMTGVRELEHRMVLAREWEHKPKPKPSEPEPRDPDSNRAYMEKVRLMYGMARLAFETDSTRLITLFLDSTNSPAIDSLLWVGPRMVPVRRPALHGIGGARYCSYRSTTSGSRTRAAFGS